MGERCWRVEKSETLNRAEKTVTTLDEYSQKIASTLKGLLKKN
jgi:hypothetical protein